MLFDYNPGPDQRRIQDFSQEGAEAFKYEILMLRVGRLDTKGALAPLAPPLDPPLGPTVYELCLVRRPWIIKGLRIIIIKRIVIYLHATSNFYTNPFELFARKL